MFALHMVHGMYPDQFKENEWELFAGLIVSDVKAEGQRHDKDLPQWIDQDRSNAISLLKTTLPSVYQTLCLQVCFCLAPSCRHLWLGVLTLLPLLPIGYGHMVALRAQQPVRPGHTVGHPEEDNSVPGAAARTSRPSRPSAKCHGLLRLPHPQYAPSILTRLPACKRTRCC